MAIYTKENGKYYIEETIRTEINPLEYDKEIETIDNQIQDIEAKKSKIDSDFVARAASARAFIEKDRASIEEEKASVLAKKQALVEAFPNDFDADGNLIVNPDPVDPNPVDPDVDNEGN